MAKMEEFPVTYTCRREECDDAFKTAAIEAVRKLSKFHGRILDAGVTINGKQPATRVEITLRIPGTVISATHEDFSRMAALDGAVEKVRKQINRFKERIRDHRVSSPSGPADENIEPVA